MGTFRYSIVDNTHIYQFKMFSVADTNIEKFVYAVGATGFGVQLLLAFLETRFNKGNPPKEQDQDASIEQKTAPEANIAENDLTKAAETH